MRTKRDRRQTPRSTSLASGKSIEDFWADAVPPDGMEFKADTASVKVDNTISVISSTLNGEGTFEKLDKYSSRVIPIKVIPKVPEKYKDKNRHIRVPVLAQDGTPLMPTKASKARRLLEKRKAKIVRNKLGIFQIQLLFEPSGRNKQDIVLAIDPGSAFTGIGVISKKAVLYGCTLELPGYKKGSKGKIEKNRFGKKIEKYPNSIVEGMTKRRELRRGRRYRKTRRRPSRWLNRSKTKIPPSILARKQLELKVVTELSKIYPISIIGFEDIKFNHFKDKEGIKGQLFSHVEVGKNWLLDRLKTIVPKGNLKIIRGYLTNIRRQQLGLKKEGDKTVRSVDSHVNDCIAMGSLILGLGIETKNKFKFDIVTRPKYSRRFLHLEQFGKGGIRRRYGGSTIPFSKLRKGDYVEAIQGKKVFRGWVSGYIEDDRRRPDNTIISVSGFDWNRLGQFGVSNVRLLGRNTQMLLRSMEKTMSREELFSQKTGTVQVGIDNAW